MLLVFYPYTVTILYITELNIWTTLVHHFSHETQKTLSGRMNYFGFGAVIIIQKVY